MVHSSMVPRVCSFWGSGWTLNPTRWAISLLRQGDIVGSTMGEQNSRVNINNNPSSKREILQHYETNFIV